MMAISVVDTLFAIGNNNLSVRAGKGVARDLREALFLKHQELLDRRGFYHYLYVSQFKGEAI